MSDPDLYTTYSTDRLKPGIWVQAQVRICDISCIAITVLKKGHADFGAILVKLYQPQSDGNPQSDGRSQWAVFSQIRLNDGRPGWMRTPPAGTPLDDGENGEKQADAYIATQLDFDPDLWVLEINDTQGLYRLDGDVT